MNEKVVFSLQLEKFENDEAAEEAHTDFWALIKKLWGSHFRIPALSLSVWCLYLYLTYNATFFGLPNLKGNIYVNSLISAMAEIIAYAVSCKPYFPLLWAFNNFADRFHYPAPRKKEDS